MIGRKLSFILICLLLFANLATILNAKTSVGYETTVESKFLDQNDPPWPMFQGDARHTGRSPYNTSRIDGSVKWNLTMNIPSHKGTYYTPTIGRNDIIYMVSDKNLTAVYPNGTEKWSFSTGEYTTCGSAIGSNGTIYVGFDRNLYAVNPNGTEKWNFTTGDELSTPVIGDNGTIYTGSADDHIYAVKPDGTQKWNFTANGSVHAPPALGLEGNVYFGTVNELYSLSPDGSKRWSVNVSVLKCPIIGDEGTIYLSGVERIHAIYPNGTRKWNYTNEQGSINTLPTLARDGCIYFGTERGYLYKLNPNGSLKWGHSIGGEIGPSPVIGSDGTAYVGNGYGGTTPPENWDGNLYAVNPNGTTKWKTSLGYMGFSPAIGSDGTIYVGSYDHNLYAIGGPPFAPKNVKSKYLDTKIRLNWSEPGMSSANKYRIYRGPSSDNKTLLKEIGSSKTYFVDENIEKGKIYHYHVTAVNGIGESDPSNDVSAGPNKTVPSKPIEVKTQIGKDSVNLSWSKPLDNGSSPITNYRIYRGKNNDTKALLDKVNASKTYYNDTFVSEDQTYHYHVTAVNAIGESDPSRNITVSFPIIPPPPTALNSKAGDGYVNLTWEEPEKEVGKNITGYKIYRESSSEGRTLIGDVNASTHFYNDTSVENGNKYLYTVVSYNDYKCSDITECPTVTGTPSEGDEDGSALIIVGIAGVLALVVISLFIHRRSKRTEEEEEENK